MGGCWSGVSQYGGGSGGLRSAMQRRDGRAAAAHIRRNHLLLEAVVDLKGNGPLHQAVALGAHGVLAELLALASGPSEDPLLVQKARRAINQGRLGDSATPLMLACDMGDVHAVSMLLLAGAEPSARDQPYRKTCLHYAAAKGHVAVITAVAEHSCSRASTSLRLRGGPVPGSRSQTPPSSPRPSPHDLRMCILKMDTSNRPFLDLASSGGLTALMVASACNQAAAVQELVLLGADPWLSCWDHNTDPLCKAAQGSSALHIAATHGALQAAQALMLECAYHLGRKALSPTPDKRPCPDPRLAPDCQGRTPCCLARARGHKEMVALLDPKVPVHLLHDAVQRSVAAAPCPSWSGADSVPTWHASAEALVVEARPPGGLGRYLRSAYPKNIGDVAPLPGFETGPKPGPGLGHSSSCPVVASLHGSLQGASSRLSTVYEADAGEALEEHLDQSGGGALGCKGYATGSTFSEPGKESAWSSGSSSRSLTML